MLEILADFLKDRKQRVVLNRQVSNWVNVTARAPQRSILGTLMFSLCVNDLGTSFYSNAKLFADINGMNNDLAKLAQIQILANRLKKSSSVKSQRK